MNMTKEKFALEIDKAWNDYYDFRYELFSGTGNGCNDYRDLDKVDKFYLTNLRKKAQNMEEGFKNIFRITYKDYKTKMNDYLNKDMGYHTSDKKKYMDAEEAYNLTTDTIEYTKEKLLETTMSQIDKAARKGEYLVHIYENISKVVIDELRNLGYEVVNNYSQREGDDFVIKWIKPYANSQQNNDSCRIC